MLRNLIGLELRKHRIGGYIRNAIIANIFAIAIVFLMLYSPNMMDEVIFTDYISLFTSVDSFVRMIFIVFAAVLISRFIIDEYKSKTINILFMYPISRKKILLSKLVIISIFTFSNIIVSEIVLNALLLTANAIVPSIQEPLTLSIIGEGAFKMIMNAMAASIMSLIPLYFGMKKYSTPTTITSSLLIVMIVCSNNGGVSLNSIIIIPIILALIGGFVTFMTIKKVDHVDVVN